MERVLLKTLMIQKYRQTSLYAVFLSANSSICDCKLAIFQECIPQFIAFLGLFYANSLHASQIFWSLSIAYNEVHLYITMKVATPNNMVYNNKMIIQKLKNRDEKEKQRRNKFSQRRKKMFQSFAKNFVKPGG